jgi:hypothetical protein
VLKFWFDGTGSTKCDFLLALVTSKFTISKLLFIFLFAKGLDSFSSIMGASLGQNLLSLLSSLGSETLGLVGSNASEFIVGFLIIMILLKEMLIPFFLRTLDFVSLSEESEDSDVVNLVVVLGTEFR